MRIEVSRETFSLHQAAAAVNAGADRCRRFPWRNDVSRETSCRTRRWSSGATTFHVKPSMRNTPPSDTLVSRFAHLVQQENRMRGPSFTRQDKKRRLGRGLGSLISTPVEVKIPPPAPATPPDDRPAAVDMSRSIDASSLTSEIAGIGAAMAAARLAIASSATGYAPSPDSAGATMFHVKHPREQPAAQEGRGGAAEPRAGGLPPTLDDDGFTPARTTIVELPLDLIDPNPYQPRRNFDPAGLQALADSIRAAGVMQPILVRPVKDVSRETLSRTPSRGGVAMSSTLRLSSSLSLRAEGRPEGGDGAAGMRDNDVSRETLQLSQSRDGDGAVSDLRVRESYNQVVRYQLIAGERRLRAAKLIPLATIPAVISEVDDRIAAEWALIENVQREDLNPIERAEAFSQLIHRFQLTHKEIGERIGMDRSSISNLLRLNELDEEIKNLVRTGRLSLGHARALLMVGDDAMRKHLAMRTSKGDWSVRELERRIKEVEARARHARGESGGASEPNSDLDAAVEAKTSLRGYLADLERQLADHLGTRVHLRPGRKKGTGAVIIEFYSLDQFDGLMSRMGIDPSSL